MAFSSGFIKTLQDREIFADFSESAVNKAQEIACVTKDAFAKSASFASEVEKAGIGTR
jgi:hypothetical protein